MAKKKSRKQMLKKLEKKAAKLKAQKQELQAQIELLTAQRDEALKQIAALQEKTVAPKKRPTNGRRKKTVEQPAAEETSRTRKPRAAASPPAEQPAAEKTSRTRKPRAAASPAANEPPKKTRRKTRTTSPAKTATIDFSKIGTATAAEKDNLRLIKGIGPAAERKLNNLGIYTYRQIANLTLEAEKIIAEKVGFFQGRIQRDQWVAQARALLKGK